MWWDRSRVHVWDGRESVVKDDVILWRNSSRSGVKDESHATCMERRVPEINSDSASWFPFRSSGTARTLSSRIQNVYRTKQSVKSFNRNIRLSDAMKSRIWCDARVVQRETIVSLGCCLKGKRPEHSVDHLRPHSYAVQKKSSSRKGEHLIFILNDAILMMSPDGAEGYFLIRAINVIKKSFVGKCAVVGVIMFNAPTYLGQNFFKSLCGKDRLVDGEIPHEVDVNKITDVIAKRRASPNPSARQKSRHLRDQSRLGGYDLIHAHAVARENMLRAPN